jgi:hypothetical protein
MKSRIGKVFLFGISILLLSLPLYAENNGGNIDLSEVEPADIDPAKVDLTEAQLFFQGPMELYISNVQYGDASYAAILDYDGASGLEIEVPKQITRKGKPVSVDLSDVSFSLGEKGVVVEGLNLNGCTYSGTFTYSADRNEFRLASARKTGRESEEKKVTSLQKVIEQQERQIENLEEEVKKKDSTIIDLNSKLREVKNGNGESLETVKRRLSTPVHSGFESGSEYIWGSWELKDGELRQTNPQNYFAKYSIPLLQSESEYLYSFRASAPPEGWVGYGLHLLVSDVEEADKYEFGDSYLLWVTRDYRHNHTDRTFVELYRSNGGGKMIRLVSKAVYEDLSDAPSVSVHTDANDEMITVYVEGTQLFSFEDRDMFTEGGMVSLRSLGEAAFSELNVYGK